MAPSAVGALLNNVPTVWAVPLAAAIGAITYDLSQFCTHDPPAVPTITADDVIALLDPYNVTGKLVATQKLTDLVGAFKWYDLCQCDSVSTPAPPTPPAAPTGMPTIDFGQHPINPTCAVGGKFPLDVGAGQSYSIRTGVDLTPLNPTGFLFDFSQEIYSGAGCDIDYIIEWTDDVGGVISSETVTVPANKLDYTTTRNYVAGAYGVHVNVHGFTGTGREMTHPDILVYCDGNQPGTPQQFSECCSDPAAINLLSQVLELVKLIQRQAVPFAFIDGPSHAALNNSGTITVTEPLIGIRVELTSVPSRVGLEVGSPDNVWETGWVALGDADGWFGQRALRFTELLWQPRWSGAVTRIGYTLLPGVVATITEMRREA